MKNLHELDKYRIQHPFWPQTDKAGSFKVFVDGRSFIVIASVDDNGDEGKWEHISVQPKNQKRCPTWNEMSEIKDMLFDPEEEAVEYHPKHSRYVNIEENCLHIWRPVDGNLLRFPKGNEAIREKKVERMNDDWWEVTFSIKIGGERFEFDELSDSQRKYIIESLARGYECGTMEAEE